MPPKGRSHYQPTNFVTMFMALHLHELAATYVGILF